MRNSTTSNRINALAFHPNGRFLATGESDPTGIVRVFSADSLSQVDTYGINLGIDLTAATALAYSPDGAFLAVLIDGSIHILETEDYTLYTAIMAADLR